MIRAHAFISGVVQGVGYRFTTQRLASQLGLCGWVRNLPDGRVEAVLEGDRETVERLLNWFHQGPPGAVVDNVTVTDEPPEGLQTFNIRR